MKEVAYSEKARLWKEGKPLFERGNKLLEEIIGASGPEEVSVAWDRARDSQGRDIIVVRLSDWAGFATAVLWPEEFNRPDYVSIRLRLLWDDLLQNRTHVQLKQLQEVGAGQG